MWRVVGCGGASTFALRSVLYASCPGRADVPVGRAFLSAPPAHADAILVLIAATPTGDGVLDVPGGGNEAFAVAVVTVGTIGRSFSVPAFSSIFGPSQRCSLPLTMSICSTDPHNGPGLADLTVDIGPSQSEDVLRVRSRKRQRVCRPTRCAAYHGGLTLPRTRLVWPRPFRPCVCLDERSGSDGAVIGLATPGHGDLALANCLRESHGVLARNVDDHLPRRWPSRPSRRGRSPR